MSEAALPANPVYPAQGPVRIVTAASLFDGHDAAINIMRRLLQRQGAEVIHLGHDRSVDDVVEAAIEEDVQAVAISSYQGGHVDFFKYLVDRLRSEGAPDIRVYGGGGGTIIPEEVEELHTYGVARIFSPEDGRKLGLDGMIRLIIDECSEPKVFAVENAIGSLALQGHLAITRTISWFESYGREEPSRANAIRTKLLGLRNRGPAPVIGVTGTGGAGKSSVVDEIVRRFRIEYPDRNIGLLLVDPTRRGSGGALLGDRIRMNAIHGSSVFVRSLATRTAHLALSDSVTDGIRVLQAAGFDLILVETAGIGQSDTEIVDLVDLALYVMTPEFGAPSQLEKIDMLEFADVVVLNKFDRHGAEDALRDVRKQWRRNHPESEGIPPVFPTMARAWNDPGTESLYRALSGRLSGKQISGSAEVEVASSTVALIPENRARYLADIATTVRGYHQGTELHSDRADSAWAFGRALVSLGDAIPNAGEAYPSSALSEEDMGTTILELREKYNSIVKQLPEAVRRTIGAWALQVARYTNPTQEYEVRGKSIPTENFHTSLSGTKVPKVALPQIENWGDIVRFTRRENVPGDFPFTAGVFPFKREDEDPTRMFAGEGGPERTNRRFHYLCTGQPAARLSTAFDSVTLYGRDPHIRPDIYGKVGTSGVSVCCLDDAKRLYSGFDLCDSKTSVSMTINGPAPVVLAFFLNTAIDQQVERHLRETGQLDEVRKNYRISELPSYRGDLPENNDGVGLGLLGIPGDRTVDEGTYRRIKTDVLSKVRGTVQADILKEDQAQNTCIFSTEFALKMMGDVQEYFIEHQIRNFYSVSISGYHIAEAGANPISQLAFTLANGFTYAEYYLSRGMDVDAFAPNFSFFFSNGLDAEYNVIGRVARRIWAIAMRERYGAGERSQKLKYHIQTSGRSLHAEEMAFNDIRTTLQALIAIQDHCNSLHTNAYDEAVTTPTPDSVRRALAIQLIINRELGLTMNENPVQGAYLMDTLTDLVEDAVLKEFDRLSHRGGVLGAMETLYQRGKIQEESLHYETLKHTGESPVIGVNTFRNPDKDAEQLHPTALMRASEAERKAQLDTLEDLWRRHETEVPKALTGLQEVAEADGNVFEALMGVTKIASLGRICGALFEVGGRYRRAM